MFVFPVRVGLSGAINSEGNTPSEYFHAFSDNISEGGLKFDLKKDLPLGTRLELRFDLIIREKVSMLTTLSEIRWRRRKSNGFYEYGILFDPLPREDWQIIKEFMMEYCR